MSKTNNIPPYILCSTPELARQVLEKIERESDLRWDKWENKKKKQKFIPNEFYPEMVIEVSSPMEWCSKRWFQSQGITNFTKAEDYLLSDETKIRLEELDNKLDKLINDMTNKTWDNLAECDSIVSDEGDVYRVVGVCGQMVFMLDNDNEIEYDHKYNLINNGYKIKGASEQKPGLDRAIELLEWTINPHNTYYQDRGTVEEAIEMLKKLKWYDSQRIKKEIVA